MSQLQLRRPFYLVCQPGAIIATAGVIIVAGLLLKLSDASALSPWLRVIIGLLIFLTPGSLLFALLPARDSWDLIDLVGYGFAFSIALITALGLITRTLSLSIDHVVAIWFLLALLCLAAVHKRFWRALPHNLKPGWPCAGLIAIIVVQVSLIGHGSIFATSTTDDQNRHHAVVNGFLRDEPLGWREPYFESGNHIADRMYLTYWVLAQALVVDISGVPILLTRYLINPFAVIMAVAAMYIFARNLGHDRRTSLFYVVLGLMALSVLTEVGRQAGSQLFVRGLLDKIVAAFALAPIAVSSAYLCATRRSRGAFAAFALSFAATASVHAIAGGFAACIIGFWCILRLLSERHDWKSTLQIGLLTLVLFTPSILVRLTTVGSTIYNFAEFSGTPTAKLIVIDAINPLDYGNNFYAINPNIVGELTYALVAIGVVGLFVRGEGSHTHHKFVFAAALAVAIGLLPYTAWIYGRLVSIDHVNRVLWLLPYGYLLGYALNIADLLLKRYIPDLRHGVFRTDSARWVILAGAGSLIITMTSVRMDLGRDISSASRDDAELLDIAEYLDARHDERVWIAASDGYSERVIAMHWKVISLARFSPQRMSYYSNLPLEDMRAQSEANSRLYKADVPAEQKMAILDRFGIDYLLFSDNYAWMVDALYQLDKQRIELVYSGEVLRLVRVHERTGQ